MGSNKFCKRRPPCKIGYFPHRIFGIFLSEMKILLYKFLEHYPNKASIFIYKNKFVTIKREVKVMFLKYWSTVTVRNLSQLMRLWHLLPSVNSIFKHTCTAIPGATRLIFGQTLRLLPYIMCVNSEDSGETAQMHSLA